MDKRIIQPILELLFKLTIDQMKLTGVRYSIFFGLSVLFIWIVTSLSGVVVAQKVGKDFKDLFTLKKKHCKIANIYCAVTVGQILPDTKYGKAIVKNYKIGNKLTIFYRYIDSKMEGRKKVVRVTKAVKNLVIMVPKDPMDSTSIASTSDLKKIVLSQKETKQIMLQQLVIKRKYHWILRMYPEERANLRQIIKRYSGKAPDSNFEIDENQIDEEDEGA